MFSCPPLEASRDYVFAAAHIPQNLFSSQLKTAKALGLTIPQSLLVRADEVVQ